MNLFNPQTHEIRSLNLPTEWFQQHLILPLVEERLYVRRWNQHSLSDSRWSGEWRWKLNSRWSPEKCWSFLLKGSSAGLLSHVLALAFSCSPQLYLASLRIWHRLTPDQSWSLSFISETKHRYGLIFITTLNTASWLKSISRVARALYLALFSLIKVTNRIIFRV